MNSFTRRVLFFMFFFSGFASLIYQIVWTRMAFASFGIILPVLSVVLSVFMLGLALGSWAGGRWVIPLVRRAGVSAAFFYAASELIIGLGAFAVPKLFVISERVLLPVGEMNSFGYFLYSALALAISIFPWCVCMGTTFPFMMAYVRERARDDRQGFSFLYLANVLGAMAGTIYTAFVLVEQLGFRHTLWVAAAANFTIAFISIVLGCEQGRIRPGTAGAADDIPAKQANPFPHRFAKVILFLTGFIAMAMEVVWSRAFTPVLKTQVYSFALIVFTYLGATFIGSWIYRSHLKKGRLISKNSLFFWLSLTAFLPVLLNDPRLIVQQFWRGDMDPRSATLLLASICPFCGLLGYLTPCLIDEISGGHPRLAGNAYAINVLGCILGPLAGCYLLLPFIGQRVVLILLGLPFVALWLFMSFSQGVRRRLVAGAALAAVLVPAIFFSRDFEGWVVKKTDNSVVRRDYMASVISFGADMKNKWLLVNGIGMTKLTPITKFIAHLPLAFHEEKPRSALVICFGMGTTYRSALSWDIDVTAVELVPSVTKAFGFYHADAENYLNKTNGHVVIDDGRRYLSRCGRKFDVIMVDPPPPVQAAGSSLLFSREFYILAKKHLNTNGIVQMWYPNEADGETAQAVLRSAGQVFPYVRCFPSVEGWGLHILASDEPIPQLDAAQLAAKMPVAAQEDLMEWSDSKDKDVAAYLAKVLNGEYGFYASLNPDMSIEVTDDQPFNEYFLLRYWKSSLRKP